MASTKDILKAQRFNRSRLVTAFQSGMPDGREVTPTRPWGPIIGGIVITLLIFGIAWVSRLFAPTLPDGWEDGSLVVDDASGARYVTIEGELHPVRNASSAHLLFPGDLNIVTTSEDQLSEISLGETVGIPDAPDKVPAPELISDPRIVSCILPSEQQWTGINIGDTEDAGSQAVYVQSEGREYLVVGGYRHLINTGDSGATNPALRNEGILNALRLPQSQPASAPATWLNLIPEGEPIEELQIPGAGESVGRLPGLSGDVEVGTLLRVSDSASQGDIYVVRTGGVVERMTPVMVQLYALGEGSPYFQPIDITTHDLGRIPLADSPLRPTWPDSIVGYLENTVDACISISGNDAGGEPQLVAGTNIDELAKAGPIGSASQSGALIDVALSDSLQRVFLVDESGRSYLLTDPQEAMNAFSLVSADHLQVSRAWLDLFPAGPELSGDAAWATVPDSGGAK